MVVVVDGDGDGDVAGDRVEVEVEDVVEDGIGFVVVVGFEVVVVVINKILEKGGEKKYAHTKN